MHVFHRLDIQIPIGRDIVEVDTSSEKSLAVCYLKGFERLVVCVFHAAVSAIVEHVYLRGVEHRLVAQPHVAGQFFSLAVGRDVMLNAQQDEGSVAVVTAQHGDIHVVVLPGLVVVLGPWIFHGERFCQRLPLDDVGNDAEQMAEIIAVVELQEVHGRVFLLHLLTCDDGRKQVVVDVVGPCPGLVRVQDDRQMGVEPALVAGSVFRPEIEHAVEKEHDDDGNHAGGHDIGQYMVNVK